MSHYHLSDTDFLKAFEDQSLNPKWFDHEAHLRLAYLHIQQSGVDQAVELICRQLKAYDMHHGDGTKYHQTLTVAAVYAVNHFIKRHQPAEFSELIAITPELLHRFSSLIDSHYSFDILSDKEARQTFVQPDLSPF